MTRNKDTAPQLPAVKPQVRLLGGIDEAMLLDFLDRVDKLPPEGPVVVEITTTGGEAETARRIAQELRSLGASREVYVLGKTYVYSAGITIMSAVPARHRFLTRDTVLLVHERRFERTVRFEGALRSAIAVARDLVAELEMAEQLEAQGFRHFAEGSQLSGEDIYEKVLKKDWYVRAEEAHALGLVGELV
jgi:ATP-dependent protease ClpP protease subunit